MDTPSAILLIHCPDQKGLVARVTDFIDRNNGNVIALDQHTDNEVGICRQQKIY